MAKQRSKKIISINMYIIILVIIVIIAIFALIKHKITKTDNTNQTEEEILEEMPLPEQSLIDMNNTENAKIENGVKENTSSKLLEPKTYKGLTIKDIKLSAQSGTTSLTATIENNTGKNYAGEEITIIFTNQDGTEYARLNGILPAINNGETNELDAETTADLVNAYNFSIAE